MSTNRYFLQLSYNGYGFHGWQKQPNARSVQEEVEAAMSLVLREPIALTGCGRTDTGVHADDYYAHFDYAGDFPKGFLPRLNKLIDAGILLKKMFLPPAGTHARFDATQRSYRYEIGFQRDPFRLHTLTVYPFPKKIDPADLQTTAKLIASFSDFTPFCKTNSDARTMTCRIDRADWRISETGWVFHISANRFLRGMIRLVVGCCLKVAEGKIRLEEVTQALEEQKPLAGSWSAPAEGLFLTNIVYPDRENWTEIIP